MVWILAGALLIFYLLVVFVISYLDETEGDAIRASQKRIEEDC